MNTKLLAQNLNIPKPQSLPDPTECLRWKIVYESIFGVLIVLIIALLIILFRRNNKTKLQDFIKWMAIIILTVGLIGLMLISINFSKSNCI